MIVTDTNWNWSEKKDKLKQKFAALTDKDLLFEECKKEEVIRKLQIKLGKTKEEMLKILAAL
ncbi:MAG: general stress protein CsbD [Bacteroidetes bacterium]|nr:general stress protein CsbD [Bacteroidota bacterium]